jgi:hypothetical protein
MSYLHQNNTRHIQHTKSYIEPTQSTIHHKNLNHTTHNNKLHSNYYTQQHHSILSIESLIIVHTNTPHHHPRHTTSNKHNQTKIIRTIPSLIKITTTNHYSITSMINNLNSKFTPPTTSRNISSHHTNHNKPQNKLTGTSNVHTNLHPTSPKNDTQKSITPTTSSSQNKSHPQTHQITPHQIQ